MRDAGLSDEEFGEWCRSNGGDYSQDEDICMLEEGEIVDHGPVFRMQSHGKMEMMDTRFTDNFLMNDMVSITGWVDHEDLNNLNVGECVENDSDWICKESDEGLIYAMTKDQARDPDHAAGVMDLAWDTKLAVYRDRFKV